MTTQTIDETVLAAYLKGELDPEGSEAVERWYDASAENQRLLGQVYLVFISRSRGQSPLSGSTNTCRAR